MREDLQNEAGISLIDIHGETMPSLLHLVLFGKASPYLHNGTLPVTAENGEVILMIEILDLTYRENSNQ